MRFQPAPAAEQGNQRAIRRLAGVDRAGALASDGKIACRSAVTAEIRRQRQKPRRAADMLHL